MFESTYCTFCLVYSEIVEISSFFCHSRQTSVAIYTLFLFILLSNTAMTRCIFSSHDCLKRRPTIYYFVIWRPKVFKIREWWFFLHTTWNSDVDNSDSWALIKTCNSIADCPSWVQVSPKINEVQPVKLGESTGWSLVKDMYVQLYQLKGRVCSLIFQIWKPENHIIIIWGQI